METLIAIGLVMLVYYGWRHAPSYAAEQDEYSLDDGEYAGLLDD